MVVHPRIATRPAPGLLWLRRVQSSTCICGSTRASPSLPAAHQQCAGGALLDMLRVLGRVCFSVVFLWSAIRCVRYDVETLVARGVPGGPSIVYLAALLSTVGALMLLCNWQPRVGATILALLLVPTSYVVDVVPLSAVRVPSPREQYAC